MIAELRIHERFIAVGTAVLHVFSPQELFTDSVAEQFFVDVVVVWHTLVLRYWTFFRKHESLKFSIRHRFIKRPRNI